MKKILFLLALLFLWGGFIQCLISSVVAHEGKVKSWEISYSLSGYGAVMLYTSEKLTKNVTYSGKVNRVVTQYIDSSDESILYIYTDKGRFEIKPLDIDRNSDEKRNDLSYGLTVADVGDTVIWIYDGCNITLKPLKFADNNEK